MPETSNTADRARRLHRLQALFLEDALADVVELGRILAGATPRAGLCADDARARKIAHDLRGTGGSYGFAAVSEAAGSLEDALLDGEPHSRLESLAYALNEAVGTAQAALHATAVEDVR